DPLTIVPVLREVLANAGEASPVRTSATNILWAIGEAGLPTLLELARAGDEDTRRRCLGELPLAYNTAADTRAGLRALIPGLCHPDQYARSSAVNGLYTIGRPAVALLRRKLDAANPAARLNAAVALLKIDKDQGRAVEQLAAALGDPDPGVRR